MAFELKDGFTILDYFTFIIRVVGRHRDEKDHKEHSSMERQENHNYPMGMTCKSPRTYDGDGSCKNFNLIENLFSLFK